jgi:hypothetical protein
MAATLSSLPITIARITITLTSPLAAPQMGIEDRLGAFFGEPEQPLRRVALRWQESAQAPVPLGELIYDPGSIWTMYRGGGRYYAALHYPGADGSAQTQGVLCANPSWDELSLTEHRHGQGWQSLLALGAGELILRTTILFTGGLVLHASGLDDNGKGIVFIGHSGAGKSTQAELWCREAGVTAMNDDRVAVRLERDSPRCYGTPWGGTAEIARNHAAPLAALIVLEQAAENSMELLAPAAAAPLILARAFLPYWDRDLMYLALTNLGEILSRVPVYRLRCRPERQVVDLVRSVL